MNVGNKIPTCSNKFVLKEQRYSWMFGPKRLRKRDGAQTLYGRLICIEVQVMLEKNIVPPAASTNVSTQGSEKMKSI